MPDSIESNCVLWLNKIMQTVLTCVESECELYSKQVKLKHFKHPLARFVYLFLLNFSQA